MNSPDLRCWKCGASLSEILLPFARAAKCKSCNADLHVCCMCRFYDTSKSDACTESLAEKVTDKKRKNFCGYFQPDAEAFKIRTPRVEQSSREELDALFGLDAGSDGNFDNEKDSREKLNDLFGLDEDKKGN